MEEPDPPARRRKPHGPGSGHRVRTSRSGGIVPSLARVVGQQNVLTTAGFGTMVSKISDTTVVTGQHRHKTITGAYLDQPDRSQGWLRM
jgi:hypothetical protein